MSCLTKKITITYQIIESYQISPFIHFIGLIRDGESICSLCHFINISPKPPDKCLFLLVKQYRTPLIRSSTYLDFTPGRFAAATVEAYPT